MDLKLTEIQFEEIKDNIRKKYSELFGYLGYRKEHKCYCKDMNKDYPVIDNVCNHCARWNWLLKIIEDTINLTLEKLRG